MDVRMPDGTIIKNVPDGMSQQDLLALYEGSKPSMAADVAKTIPSAAVRGLTGLVGLPADLLDLASSGFANVAGKFTTPETAAQIKKAAAPEFPTPTSKRLQSGVESLTGELYKPQTRAGKIAGGITEAVAPSSLFGKYQALLGLLSGAGSEAAGAATGDNPYAKAVGGLLAPVGYQAASAYRGIPGHMIREATGDLTPQQLEEAKALMQRGQQAGVPLMAPEALPPSSIQQLGSDVLASKEGGRVMNRFLADRPGQVRSAVQRDILDPIGAANTPDANMARARSAATDVISAAEKQRTATASPFYKAGAADAVPQQQVQAIIQQIDAALPNMSPESRAIAEAFKRDLLATSPTAGAMDDLYKVTRNKTELPSIGATSEQKTVAGVLGPFKGQLDDAIKGASPNIKTGRQVYSQYTQDVIDPLTSGPVGRVAGRQGFDPSVPENLNPVSAVANEKVARPESIRELYSHLNKQDPQAFPGIARTWLENAFDQAAQKVQAGDNRMAGANFVKGVFGSPQQEANFLETMKGVAIANGKNPDDFAKGAKNLMEVLQATGRVPGAGSPTGGRLPTNQMAGNSKIAASMESVSASPLTPLAKKIREWTMGSNYKTLAEVLTAPDAIDQIIRIGKYKPNTTTTQALAWGLLEGANEAGASGQ